jgi:bifunctional UDP-N-acetylglucosamine pyrophosphorylase / glucosamine-1-phosphate N-acetyltransferase
VSEDAAIVLAAGKGTRMRSNLPKVLHPVAGKTMLRRVLEALRAAGFSTPSLVIGYKSDLIRQAAGERCRYVEQQEQLGTGHAARVGLESLPTSVRRILLVHGDEPLIPDSVYSSILRLQEQSAAAVVLLTTHVADTRGFGRVVRNHRGVPTDLRQESELDAGQRQLDEVNLGAYVFDADFLRRNLPKLLPHAPKGEYYLTDVIALAEREGAGVTALTIPGGVEVMGINDLTQLEQTAQILYLRNARRLMENGVTIVNASNTFIDDEVRIEPDTIIRPFSVIEGGTIIGGACDIGPYSRIVSSTIGARCWVTSSTLEFATLSDDVKVGPYAHLRAGARVGAGSEIGNYAEIKQAILGPRTRMHHVSYLGDAVVGADVNIGAGTITCNFDGVAKHRTVIQDEAFIGSDTMLRAPLTVGRGATTGAGSVVIRDVSPGSVVAGVPAREITRKRSEALSEPGIDEMDPEAQDKRGA